ncbi:MAG: hypothetical protein Q4A69_08405 [Moraxella sp.]|nr:hypothetical protein [Moraxella sp.]
MTKSELFKKAHALTKATVRTGDSYSATFAICLKVIYQQTKETDFMKTLLVKEFKGYSFRLIDVATNETYRAMKKEHDLAVGSLLTVNELNVENDLIKSMVITNEIVGDSSKKRIEVCVDEVKLGDLIDGIPVLNFGKIYAKKGKKMAYAYFG